MTGWRSALGEFFSRVSTFRRVEPIRTAGEYCDFLAKRAAFVGQKKLYEYVKTRMGLSYPEHFRDDDFIASLNIAKWRVYAACLSDLGIWMAAQSHAREGHADETRLIAMNSFAAVLDDRFTETSAQDISAIRSEFENRVAVTDWNFMGQRDNAFTLSPRELVRWAPIADKLKRYDEEIVENSIRFAWVQIRSDFNRVYAHDLVISDWRNRGLQ